MMSSRQTSWLGLEIISLQLSDSFCQKGSWKIAFVDDPRPLLMALLYAIELMYGAFF